MVNDAISKFFCLYCLLFTLFIMIEYTSVLLYDWSKHGDEIKRMFHDNKLKWNPTKIKRLTTEELSNEYIKFKVDKDFKIEEIMIGSSGIYENKDSNIAIKIIKTESVVETVDDIDNMLIIYKGIEEKFYIELMKKFRDIGCLVIKIVDNEIVFKSRINVKLINSLNDIQGEKDVKIGNFIKKTRILDSMFHETYSDDFKQQWIECINKN